MTNARTDVSGDVAVSLHAPDEIDMIVGAGSAGTRTEFDPPTLNRLIHGKAVSYERLPMAEIVFERLVRSLGGSLRNLFQDNVEVRLTDLTSQRLTDRFPGAGDASLHAVFRAREWDNLGVMVVDYDTICSLTEILLGGRTVTPSQPRVTRPLTSIERNLTERLIRLILHDLTVSFAPICAVTFELERTETDPRFATVGRNTGAALTARIGLTTANRSGTIGIILPYATIEPVRELLLQQFMGEKFGRDSIWEAHLAEELWHTDIELEAVLDQQTMKLSTLMHLQEGDVMPLGTQKGATIALRCGDVSLFNAQLGIRNGRIAAEIDNKVDQARRRSN
ncbi:MAG: FliM/FliN family flagellar motor switch protein [Acidiphilium sp.]|nr:FliM/FliN family flagellar motor switch protein [Acidiphilium sp.]MDD4935204.1 FliM/FliN family flagellar motor switch protein [Acidiphilium sp.]